MLLYCAGVAVDAKLMGWKDGEEEENENLGKADEKS